MAKNNKFIDDSSNIDDLASKAAEEVKIIEATDKKKIASAEKTASKIKKITKDISEDAITTKKTELETVSDLEVKAAEETTAKVQEIKENSIKTELKDKQEQLKEEEKLIVFSEEKIDKFLDNLREASRKKQITEDISAIETVTDKEKKIFTVSINNKSLTFKRNVEHENKIFKQLRDSVYKADKDSYEQRQKDKSAIAARIQQLEKKQKEKTITDSEKEELLLCQATNEKLLLEDERYFELLEDLRKKAIAVARTHEINEYKKLSAEKKREYNKELYDNLSALEAEKKEERAALLKQQEEQREIAENPNSSTEAKEAANKKLEDINEKLKKNESDSAEIKEQKSEAKKGSTRLSFFETFSEDARKAAAEIRNQHLKESRERSKQAKSSLKDLDTEFKSREDIKEIERQIAAVKKSKDQKDLKDLQEKLAAERKAFENSMEYIEAKSEAEEAAAEEQQDRLAVLGGALKDAGDALVDAVGDTAKAAFKQMTGNISGNLESMYGKQGEMMGRLQGSGIDWKDAVKHISKTVGMSGAVSQKELVGKMTELVDSGIAFNLELRAFLAETSENIASTFDAANGTLLRLIRLQQADTTAARLGMEAALTKLLNSAFKDSSYLADNTSETVSGAILDAAATMNRDDAIAFEFNVQKWLGSLYSLGMSSEAINTIAQGINYLGTGNVSSLSSNESLQTLFAMSASRISTSTYADILTKGLTAETTNALLKSMVEYISEIASSQTNYVTKSAYAELFGMSITDLNTFSSLRKSEIEQLSSLTASYNSLMGETQTQLSSITSRIHLTKLVDTAIDNAEVGAATTIGNSAALLASWKATEVLREYIGSIKIPGITGFGTGFSSEIDLLNLAQTAIAGFGLLGSLVSGLGSLSSGGPTKLSNWDYQPYTSRGSSLSLIASGVSSSTSESGSLGTLNASGDDASSTSLESGKESGMDATGTTSEEMEEDKKIPKKIYQAIAEDDLSLKNLLVLIYHQLRDDRIFKTDMSENSKVLSLLDSKRVFHTTIAGVLNTDGVKKYTDLGDISSEYKSEYIKTFESALSTLNMVNLSSSSSSSSTDSSSSSSSTDVTKTLNDLLDPKRVFYTAITGVTTKNLVSQITNLSSQVESVSSSSQSSTTTSGTTTSGTTSSKSNAFTSAATRTVATEVMELQSVIANAVAEGIRAYTNKYTSLPVSNTK